MRRRRVPVDRREQARRRRLDRRERRPQVVADCGEQRGAQRVRLRPARPRRPPPPATAACERDRELRRERVEHPPVVGRQLGAGPRQDRAVGKSSDSSAASGSTGGFGPATASTRQRRPRRRSTATPSSWKLVASCCMISEADRPAAPCPPRAPASRLGRAPGRLARAGARPDRPARSRRRRRRGTPRARARSARSEIVNVWIGGVRYQFDEQEGGDRRHGRRESAPPIAATTTTSRR